MTYGHWVGQAGPTLYVCRCCDRLQVIMSLSRKQRASCPSDLMVTTVLGLKAMPGANSIRSVPLPPALPAGTCGEGGRAVGPGLAHPCLSCLARTEPATQLGVVAGERTKTAAHGLSASTHCWQPMQSLANLRVSGPHDHHRLLQLGCARGGHLLQLQCLLQLPLQTFDLLLLVQLLHLQATRCGSE